MIAFKVEQKWIADTGRSRFMMPSADFMVNYGERGGAVRISVRPIEGIGNLKKNVWSDRYWIKAIMPNVAHDGGPWP